MKERPILFSAPMVRAILDGKKTQTRRVVRLPDDDFEEVQKLIDLREDYLDFWRFTVSHEGATKACDIECPYGMPGDRLWVRETWGESGLNRIEYRAFPADGKDFRCVSRWRPSIHMPRSACRLILELTKVRAEKLQSIPCGGYMFKSDVQKEGCPFPNIPELMGQDEIQWFRDLWNGINGKGSWESDPWVWVIEFKRVANG